MIKKTTKKGVLINLNLELREYLRSLAEINSSSMSQEVRRLILDEQKRNKRMAEGSTSDALGTWENHWE